MQSGAGHTTEPAARAEAPDGAGLLYTLLYMAATRTQIYLTGEQRRRLDELARRDGKALAQLIREAVDAYLADSGPALERALAATFGGVPDLEAPSRDEWDRG